MRRLDHVHYDLGLEVGKVWLEHRIAESVAKLPQDVYDFVVDHVQFELASNQMINRREIRKKRIVLLTHNASKFTILPEIAHAFLGHRRYTTNLQQEEEADQLANEWLKSHD